MRREEERGEEEQEELLPPPLLSSLSLSSLTLSLSSLANENLEEEVTGGKSQARREVRRGDDDAIQGKYETRVSR